MAHATSTEAPSVIDEAGRAGVSAQLGELFQKHGRTVYSLCLVLLRDPHEAEDAAQQAFLCALESLRAEYAGLVKTYRRPFTPEQHDALTDQDYLMVVWKGGKIVPVP